MSGLQRNHLGPYLPSTGNGEGGGDVDYSKITLKIDNISVNKGDNDNINAIEVGDQLIQANLPVGSNRYISADVVALPYTNDANLKIISTDYKQE